MATYVRLLPVMCRVAIDLQDAMYAAGRNDYVVAERYLRRIYALGPPAILERTSANLLKALVCLRLGSPAAAVDLARAGVAQVGALRRVHNSAERAYLQFAGAQIFEDASKLIGAPRTLDIGLTYDELDVAKVSALVRDAFPIRRPAGLSSVH